MKHSTNEAGGFVLTVTKGRDHGTTVPPLATSMVHLALSHAGVTTGKYGYMVTGTYMGHLQKNRHHMSVSPAKGRQLRLNMKCGSAKANTLTGILNIPNGIDLAKLNSDLQTATRNLNSNEWKDLWPRNGSCAELEDHQITKENSLNKLEESTSEAHVSNDFTQSEVNPTCEVSVNQKDFGENIIYANLLLDILKGKPNGVFSQSSASDVVYSHFPERNRRGLSSG